MEINKPTLILELNEQNFIFLVIEYNESLSFKVLENLSVPTQGFDNNKIIDINLVSRVILNGVEKIEKKINYIFKKISIILDQDEFNCINISGFKKLNGSQLQNEDVSYILNNLKSVVLENEPKKTLIHIFNSKYLLDGNVLNNLPIGLHGDFYQHQLSLFLFPKNDLKNLKLVFNKCNLNIEKVIFKKFAEGVHHINKDKLNETFLKINIKCKKISINYFNKSSLIYSEVFNFGSDIIVKDIMKVCALPEHIVRKILKEIFFSREFLDKKKNIFLEEKYFQSGFFRKISLSLIDEVISSRVSEIISLIYKKNINVISFKNNIKIIYISIEDTGIVKNMGEYFKNNFPEDLSLQLLQEIEKDHLNMCLAAARLLGKGWEKEAIPIVQTKKSLVSKIFSSFFE